MKRFLKKLPENGWKAGSSVASWVIDLARPYCKPFLASLDEELRFCNTTPKLRAQQVYLLLSFSFNGLRPAEMLQFRRCTVKVTMYLFSHCTCTSSTERSLRTLRTLASFPGTRSSSVTAAKQD